MIWPCVFASSIVSFPSHPTCVEPSWVSLSPLWLSCLVGGFASGQGHDGAMAVDKVSAFGWFWGEGGRRGPDGQVLPSSLATLCGRGLSKNTTRASPGSWAEVGLKNVQDRGKLGRLA